MAAITYDRCLTCVFKYEGGFVNHPADPGGATNMGITLATLSKHRGRPCTVADVKNLSRSEAAEIYRASYWGSVRGDDLPSGVDLAVFDFAVNSGQSRAIAALQRAVGVADDGHLGPLTIEAVKKADPRAVVTKIMSDRLTFLRRLSTWKTFGKGWLSRVQSVEREALAMVGTAKPIGPKPPPDVPTGTATAPAKPGVFSWAKKAFARNRSA